MANETRDSLQSPNNSSRHNGTAKAAPPQAANARAQARKRASERRRLEREKSAVARDELDRIVEIYGQPESPIPMLPQARPSTAIEDAQRHVREDLSILRHGSRTLLSAAIDLGRTPLRLWGAFRLWRAQRLIQSAAQGEARAPIDRRSD